MGTSSLINTEIPMQKMPEITKLHDFIDEELVNIEDYFLGKIYIEPVYYNCNFKGAQEKCYVRESVVKKLEYALNSLPENLTFKILDAWRPITVQKEMYDSYYKQVQEKHPQMSKKELEKETTKFVSKPIYSKLSSAVHSTGGAIDLTIVYKDSGNALEMGTEFDSFTNLSHTNAFENTKNELVKENRRMLYWSMVNAGFTNLPSEWWHYDYGDRFWSYYKNEPAKYSGIIEIQNKVL